MPSIQPPPRLRYGVWLGAGVYLLALAGTLVLASNDLRLVGVLFLIVAAVLSALLWGRQSWPSSFGGVAPAPSSPEQKQAGRGEALLASFKKDSARLGLVMAPLDRRLLPLGGAVGALLLLSGSDFYYAANPAEPFGVAGWLWLLSMGALLVSTFARGKPRLAAAGAVEQVATTLPVRHVGETVPQPTPNGTTSWPVWEIGIFAGITLLALALRVWNLSAYPNNIYPDEIMTGQVADAFGTRVPPSLFSTVWGGIDLPALWFRIVWGSMQLGGHTLAMLRLPAALFGAATVAPFYLLVRMVWGRASAICGAAILAFSASNIHFSRLALNNIVTPFFWAVCSLFLLRGLRSRKSFDWAVAGLAAGLSEHFYYGTRLLPFILLAFFCYLLAVHWREAKSYLAHFGLLALGYVVGFGPLLIYFVRYPGLYFGRGAEMSVWHTVPTSLDEFGRMVGTLWLIMSENLLGISTHSSQDITFFAPLLLPAEAALLVLGVGLLVWKWRHPAAFLMLLSGLGVLFVGGTLVMEPNGAPPQTIHWTAAFPAFYAAIAVPIGAWLRSGSRLIPARRVWIMPAAVATGLAVLALLNLTFYFNSYHSDPDSLTNERYRAAQGYYDAQTARSRYIASLGAAYRVVQVGSRSQPYDPQITVYLLGASSDIVSIANPDAELAALEPPGGKGMAFILFPGTEQYLSTLHTLFPGGKDGQVSSQAGKLIFYTYEVPPR